MATTDPQPNSGANAFEPEEESSLPDLPIIPYPASLPTFSPTIESLLSSGNKEKILVIYNEIVKEAKSFYANLIPRETARAKLSYSTLGKSIIEKYPVLTANENGSNPWNFFTGKLSYSQWKV